jgi:3-dehydroquinate synthase
MKNTKIIVKTKNKNYPIYIGENIINLTGSLIKKNLSGVKNICVIADKNLPVYLLNNLKKSLKNYNVKIYKFNVSEKMKSFLVANKIIEDLLKNNFNRSDCIIAFGGGIIGDLSGLVSSLTKRGLKFVNIPSTLLAQVDASIGGKNGINSNQGKNLIGTFYQPDFIITDITMLKSLPAREMVCGYGEILKHSLILDKKFFLWLSKNAKEIIANKNKKLLKIAITKSCQIKSKVIAKDEYEKNLRMILNFGHSFAHGFEGAKNFSKKLNHGEAVLLGMIMACELAYLKKILNYNDLLLIKKHYHNLNLPMDFNKVFKKKEIKKIIYFMIKDKKNLTGKISLILINKIGQINKPIIFHVGKSEIEKFLISQST